MHTWDDLRGLSLARQFPEVAGRDVDAVAATVDRIGPIQSQTARSPFLGLAARMPGVTRETVGAAYDDLRIVRSSTLRGTVHTSTAADHALLEVATRTGQRALWNRMLRPLAPPLEEVWAGIEDFARDTWRTPEELSRHLRDWLATHDPAERPALDSTAGRYLGFGHGGLLRRPLSGGWERQGAPGYRAAAALLGDRTGVLGDPDTALDQLVRRHLAAHGPSSRHDLSWWAGVGLRVVDASLERLAPGLVEVEGPEERRYHDLPEAPAPIDLPGVRLLPEFDALFCGYAPAARDRFVRPDHHQQLWSQANGLLRAPLLVDGRLTGAWRVPGSGVRRPCEVRWFAGTRPPRRAELEEPVAALEAAYGIEVSSLDVARE